MELLLITVVLFTIIELRKKLSINFIC